MFGTTLTAPRVLPMLAFLVFGAPTFAVARFEAKASFEVYKDKAGEYRWRLKAANGKILAVPEDAYKNLADAKKAVATVKADVARLKVEYATDKGDEHRWHVKAANGRVMARSSEGYSSKAAAEKAYRTVRDAVKEAEVKEIKE